MENETKVDDRPADWSINLPKLVQRVRENKEEDDEFMDYIGDNERFDDNYVATLMALQEDVQITVTVDGFDVGHSYHDFCLFEDVKSNAYHWQDYEHH